jgi:hypothetical protein
MGEERNAYRIFVGKPKEITGKTKTWVGAQYQNGS